MKRLIPLLLCCCLPLTSLAAEPPQSEAPFGADLAPAPTWSELSAEERRVLAPLAEQFDRLDNQQRRKWRALAERGRRWSPEQLARAQSRMALWAQMTPRQRAAAREQARALREAKGANAPQDRAQSWRQWSEARPNP